MTLRRQDALAAVPRFRALVGMGGNLGDVQACLQAALAGLRDLPGTQLEAVSSLYRTRPVDASGPDYLNAVAALQTALAPHELLRTLLALETANDRQRPYQNAPRTLDLDLLWHGGARRNSVDLTLPHPRMMQRAFVLEPLAEVLAALEADTALLQNGPLGGSLTGTLTGPALPDQTLRAQLARAQGIVRLGPFV